MVFSFSQRSQLKHYECIARVNTESPVTALGLSPDGSLLGIGSASGLEVYRGEAKLSVPIYQPMFRAVSAIEWVPVEVGDLVIFGSRSGWIFVLSNAEDPNAFLKKSEYRAGANGGVVSLNTYTMSPSCLRIAAGMSNGVIAIHEFDFKGCCVELHLIAIENVIPQALIFEAAGAQLLLIGKDNGRLNRVDIKENAILSEIHVSPNVGSAAFCTGQVIVDNTIDGFSLYRIDTGEMVHTFKTARSFENLDIQTCFMGTGRWVASGSDHGKVYIFDVQKLRMRDIFSHGGLVTHVKASDFVGGHIIACAADTEVAPRRDSRGLILEQSKPSHVKVWKSTSSGSSRIPKTVSRISFVGWIYRILVFACICSTALNVVKHIQSAPFAQGLIQGSITLAKKGSHVNANPSSNDATTTSQPLHQEVVPQSSIQWWSW